MNKGYPAAFSAYTFWGLSPIFWKFLSAIPAFEILIHRIIWSLPFLLLIIFYRNGLAGITNLFKNIINKKLYFLSAFLLAVNWLIFIWSVNNGYVVEASLGYFINPLVNVVLGVLLLKEGMRRLQWVAIFLALTGVLYLTFNYGNFPWIALSLAGTFAFYGYIRKIASLGSIDGLAFEMLVIYLPGLIVLGYFQNTHQLVFLDVPFSTRILLIGTGLITTLPLLLFAFAARKIPYSTLGFIQYIAPSFQFLLGVFLYHENFSTERFIGFTFIWLALIIYSMENISHFRRKKLLV